MTVTDDAPTTDPPDEALTPELVTPDATLEPASEPGMDVERHDGAARSAIEAAAEAALAFPGVPGRDEFLALAAQARLLSLSAGAPKAVRNNPHLAFHLAMIGRDLGISPTASIELIDVIEGKVDQSTGEKGYRLSLSPQLINGQIRRLGLGSIRPIERDEFHCVAAAVAPDGEVLGYAEFTWEDARMAGLVGEKCEPGQHVEQTITRGQKSWKACGCNQGYITYPKRMMWWRAAGFAADDYFPEAGLGLYSPEALGSVVDEHGRPIDPTTVELPDGYAPALPAAPTEKAPPPIADGDALWELQARIRALPDEQRVAMREKWLGSTRLTFDPPTDGADRPPIPAYRLPQRGLSTAESLIKGFERIAEKAGADLEELRHDVDRAIGTRLVASLMAPIFGLVADDAGQDAPGPENDVPGAAVEPEPQPEPPARPVAPEGDFDRATTKAWVDSLDPLGVADMLTEFELDGTGSDKAKRARLLVALESRAAHAAGLTDDPPSTT